MLRDPNRVIIVEQVSGGYVLHGKYETKVCTTDYSIGGNVAEMLKVVDEREKESEARESALDKLHEKIKETILKKQAETPEDSAGDSVKVKINPEEF